MSVFEITIQRNVGDGWPVVALESDPDGALPLRHEGQLSLDRIELLALTSPLRYGTCLGQALFHDTIRDAFIAARYEAQGRLRVLLSVEAPDLRDLHWERLCAPDRDGWDHLALGKRALFSLYLPNSASRRFPLISRHDLSALILIASPANLEEYGLPPFDAAEIMDDVPAALDGISSTLLGSVKRAAGPPTLDALCEQLMVHRSTLLHVVCHSRLTYDGEAVLYLADDSGHVDPVTTSRLMKRLRLLHDLPHLAFLALSATDDASHSLGQRMVRELGLPAVVTQPVATTINTSRILSVGFYRRLLDHGEADRAVAEATTMVAEGLDLDMPALYSRLGAKPIFSTRLDRELTETTVELGLRRLDALMEERAPVLQARLNASATTLRQTFRTAPDARGEHQAALADVDALCEEIVELSFNALAFGDHVPPYDGRCPFRGLYPFQFEDRGFFFGREDLVERLCARLTHHNFLAVLGASGSGKSSLVQAGLVPALQDAQPGLQVIYLMPGADPVDRLNAALASETGAPSVLVVDQFEELFTLCTDALQRRAFTAALMEASTQRTLILAMRADFWGESFGNGAFTEAIQSYHELIAPLDAQELRASMDRQAATVGLRFEVDLANTILDDVQGEPAAMSLVQHALLELWRRRHGRWLRTSEYRAIGGVQQAIAHTAEEAYQSLDSEDQVRARGIFVRLTRLDEEPGYGGALRDTRWRVPRAELVQAGDDPERMLRLVARLADAALLVTSVNASSSQEMVEVAHEALILHWPRLRGWLDGDRAYLLWRQRLHRDHAEWERTGQDEGRLLRGYALAEAERWVAERPRDLTPAELRFIQSSRAGARASLDLFSLMKTFGLGELGRRVQRQAEAYETALHDYDALLKLQQELDVRKATLQSRITSLGKELDQSTPLVFVSYAREDFDRARVLYQNLKDKGLRPWMDTEDLLPGENWEAMITDVVKRCNAFIVCLSKIFVSERGFRHKEIGMALEIAKEMPQGSIYIIPVRLEVCDVPEDLAGKHWIDLFDLRQYDRIVEAVLRDWSKGKLK